MGQGDGHEKWRLGGRVGRAQMYWDLHVWNTWISLVTLLVPGISACFRLLGSPSQMVSQLSFCRFKKTRGCPITLLLGHGEVSHHLSSACPGTSSTVHVQTWLRLLCLGGQDLPLKVLLPSWGIQSSEGCVAEELEFSSTIYCQMLGHCQVVS